MSMSTPLPTSVPNEGTPVESLSIDQNVSQKRRFSVTQLLVPPLLVASVSVALGLLPYLRLRQHLIRQGRILGEVRAGVEDGNRTLAEYIRSRDVNSMAHQLQHQKSQTESQLKFQLLEEKYRSLEAVSTEQKAVLSAIRNQLEETNARGRELEQTLEDIGQQMGSTLGQLAAFVEETQRVNGQGDHYGAGRMRAFALLLQSWRERATGTKKDSGSTSQPLE